MNKDILVALMFIFLFVCCISVLLLQVWRVLAIMISTILVVVQ